MGLLIVGGRPIGLPLPSPSPIPGYAICVKEKHEDLKNQRSWGIPGETEGWRDTVWGRKWSLEQMGIGCHRSGIGTMIENKLSNLNYKYNTNIKKYKMRIDIKDLRRIRSVWSSRKPL